MKDRKLINTEHVTDVHSDVWGDAGNLRGSLKNLRGYVTNLCGLIPATMRIYVFGDNASGNVKLLDAIDKTALTGESAIDESLDKYAIYAAASYFLWRHLDQGASRDPNGFVTFLLVNGLGNTFLRSRREDIVWHKIDRLMAQAIANQARRHLTRGQTDDADMGIFERWLELTGLLPVRNNGPVEMAYWATKDQCDWGDPKIWGIL